MSDTALLVEQASALRVTANGELRAAMRACAAACDANDVAAHARASMDLAEAATKMAQAAKALEDAARHALGEAR